MNLLNELVIGKKAVISQIQLGIDLIRQLNIAGIRENIIVSISHWYNKNVAVISSDNGRNKIALSTCVMKKILVNEI